MVIMVLLHDGFQVIVDELQQAVQVDVFQFPVFLQHRNARFRRQVPSASGHPHETPVQYGSAAPVGSQGIGRRQGQVVMTMEGDGNAYALGQQFHGLFHFVRQHAACRVHNGKFIQAGRFQFLGGFCQFFRRNDVRLHSRIKRLHAVLFDDLNGFNSQIRFIGIHAHPQESQVIGSSQFHVFLAIPFGVQEHPHLARSRIRLHQLQVLFIRFRLGETSHFVGPNAAGVAHFNIVHIAVNQCFQHHRSQIGIKALAHHIAAVT